MNYKLTTGTDVLRLNDDGSTTTIPAGHRLRAEYDAWVDDGNTPDPAHGLEELRAIAAAKALDDYRAAISQPINDGVDDIDMGPVNRQKINNSRQTGKVSVKAQRQDGRPKTYTQAELDDLIDMIDDRDDTLLDQLDATLDAIEAATDLTEYLPDGY